MDWAVWDHTFDRDVIEETALNEKSCIQVLEALISNANAEILELEQDLIILKSQLAWADESWSEKCSAALNGKIDCLDISLRSLENADVHEEHDFGGCLLSHREPAEEMHRLLQPLVENYFNQEHEQNNEQTVNSVVSKEDLSLETEKKDVAEKDKPADHPVEFRSCALHEVTEESDVNPKLAGGLFSATTNNVEPPLSSFKVGKKRAKSPRKLKSPDVALADTEKKAVDSLLLLLNNKKELKGKSKLAAIVGESNPNLPPKPQKQRAKRGHQQKQQAKLVLDVDKDKKRKRQSSLGVEEVEKLKSLQFSLAKLCANTTATTNAEDLSDTKRLFTDDSMKSETPKLLPSPVLPCPEARVLDLESLTLADLRAIAKQQKMRGYSSLRKSKLTEQLSLKLMV